MNQIRVAIIDDQPLFRSGVACALAGDPDLKVVCLGSTADEALRIARDMSPDVIIMDITVAGDGLAALGTIVASHPRVKTLVLSMASDQARVCAAMQKGARGYLLKTVETADLIQAVRLIARGGTYVAPALAAYLLAHLMDKTDPFAALSVREDQVLKLIAHGLSNKEVGRRLSLTEKTIKCHVSNMLQKLQLRNRVEAAMLVKNAA
jgi:DNA-binding NarL/FixJ family response regulator